LNLNSHLNTQYQINVKEQSWY